MFGKDASAPSSPAGAQPSGSEPDKPVRAQPTRAADPKVEPGTQAGPDAAWIAQERARLAKLPEADLEPQDAASASQDGAPGEKKEGNTDLQPDTALSLLTASQGAQPPSLGALNAPGDQTLELPARLLDPLTPREAHAAHYLAAGKSWQLALTYAGFSPHAGIRSYTPAFKIRQAAEWLMQRAASLCAVSPEWIISQTVALYLRATQAEPVLDRKGIPTGTYRFDGATARACLEMLGNQQGMFRQRGGSIAVSDVATLLEAVAAKGRPALPADRGRVIDAVPQNGHVPRD